MKTKYIGILSAIAQVLCIKKAIEKGIHLELERLSSYSCFYYHELISDKIFAGPFSRVVGGSIGNEGFSIIPFIEAKIVEPSGDFYYFGEDGDCAEELVEKYVENGVTEFYLDGDEIDKDFLVEKYKLHESVVKEAEELFSSVLDYIKTKQFSFIEGLKYETPLYVALLCKALEELKQGDTEQANQTLKNTDITDKEAIEIVKKYADVFSLKNLAVKGYALKEWKETIELI